MFIGIAVAVVVLVVLISWGNVTGFSIFGSGKYDDFAKCLTDSGAKMYGTYWCPFCQQQKDMFAKSWKHVEYVECSLPNRGGQTAECNAAGIKAYPTWEFADGQRFEGLLNLQQLSQITGCPLE
jgi:hypothetical protein